jgi:hypothetical protein
VLAGSPDVDASLGAREASLRASLRLVNAQRRSGEVAVAVTATLPLRQSDLTIAVARGAVVVNVVIAAVVLGNPAAVVMPGVVGAAVCALGGCAGGHRRRKAADEDKEAGAE